MMNNLMFLVAGVIMMLCSVCGICDDVKNRRAWWRWVLDILGIAVGAWFLYCFFCNN